MPKWLRLLIVGLFVVAVAGAAVYKMVKSEPPAGQQIHSGSGDNVGGNKTVNGPSPEQVKTISADSSNQAADALFDKFKKELDRRDVELRAEFHQYQGVAVTPTAVVPLTPPQKDLEVEWGKTDIARDGDEITLVLHHLRVGDQSVENAPFKFQAKVGPAVPVVEFLTYRLVFKVESVDGPNVAAVLGLVPRSS